MSINRKTIAKYIFIIVAGIIVAGSLVISNNLVNKLSNEEEQRIRLWAEAMRIIASSEAEDAIDPIVLQIMSSNTTIPILLCDEDGHVTNSSNIELPNTEQDAFLQKKLEEFRSRHDPITIDIGDSKQYLYYDDSYTLKQLQVYPFIQIGVLTIFVLVSFFALLSTKKAEQNKVWVGLSKETAHQLGTPISSLMAWIEYLRMKNVDPSIITDMEKDVTRLQIITDRFSKIGSTPTTSILEIQDLVRRSVGYMEGRISKKVNLSFNFTQTPLYAYVNEPLFGWVIENLSKNAVDAMEGKGAIKYSLTLSPGGKMIWLDIEDTGKGIPKSKFKDVFHPGYTTKSRGWGLGLSLVKRIIEEYHHGKIYVKSSEIGVGTTFRIELKTQQNEKVQIPHK
ncbi:two-component system, sporulation sensor kinase D [Dysgonomonas sp. PH5-45]|uniref:sensor histidine kinase n=1 Tax=unclassified Dysgonomonas TaxID=2630389 RepID=UPI002476D615|nr:MULTISPECIES: HAMP domain-containing sensor histidine kinase [unclassified Dysgonomonas]MDH6355496.1 two-component system, sporulation sensor kinase D [Dysgonomonas sp. PH5-45]MDH6388392.1 two-component system, sporulation sensor kinase D [Dysgonomonas sp. PH5-37]